MLGTFRDIGGGFNTTIFDCPSFSSTGACGVDVSGNTQNFWAGGTVVSWPPTLSAGAVHLIPNSAVHVAINMNYQTLVNIQKFQTTFTFQTNGMNLAFTANNSNNQTTFNTNEFSAGAGCEAAFFQGFPGAGVPVPNNVFAVEFDSYSPLTSSPGTFTYSNVQWYWANGSPNAPLAPGQSPCIPDQGQAATPTYNYVEVTKLSTSPVAMNSPSNSQNTATGHTFSATLTYDSGTQVLDLLLWDVTAGGTCVPPTSGTCFHNVWTGVDIPTAVGGNTAWIGIGGATGIASTAGDAVVTGWKYKTP